MSGGVLRAVVSARRRERSVKSGSFRPRGATIALERKGDGFRCEPRCLDGSDGGIERFGDWDRMMVKEESLRPLLMA